MKKTIITAAIILFAVLIYSCNDSNSAGTKNDFVKKANDTSRVVLTYEIGMETNPRLIQDYAFLITKDTLKDVVVDSTSESVVTKKKWTRDSIYIAPMGLDTARNQMKQPLYDSATGKPQMTIVWGILPANRIYEVLKK
jgi:hypothetical protein